MRQIQRLPFRIIKLSLGKLEFTCLGKIALSEAKSEVAGRVRAVAKLEFPAKVKEQLIARRHRGQRLSRSRPRIASKKSSSTPPG